MYFRGNSDAIKEQKIVSEKVHNTFLNNLQEHIIENNIKDVGISLHGGEPLIIGKEYFEKIVLDLRLLCVKLNIPLRLKLQTNGILLDREWLELFIEYDVIFGISLDGPKEINDIFRKDFSEKGTFEKVINAIELVKEYESLNRDIPFGGIIAVINPKTDPKEFFDFFFQTINVKYINILLPDCDHDSYEKYNDFSLEELEQYLIELFEIWYNRRNEITIPFFNNIIKSILGYNSSIEDLGMTLSKTIVITTNGRIEPHDVLRINDFKNGSEGINVFGNKLSDVLDNAKYNSANNFDHLNNKNVRCSSCPVKSICGGGFIGHRFSKEKLYLNHSVYCDALFGLISHIYFKIRIDLFKAS